MKGFYDDISNNANNEYLKAIAACTRGLELPPFQELDRAVIAGVNLNNLKANHNLERATRKASNAVIAGVI